MIMKTISESPWGELSRADGHGCYNAKLIGPDVNPDGKKIYWAKGRSGLPCLLVEYADVGLNTVELPKFKNIAICDLDSDRALLLELQERDMEPHFLQLCLDIAGSIQHIPAKAIRKMTLMRLATWASFLKTGRALLSSEQQKGLIGELLFLQRVAAPVYGAKGALSGWIGPDSAKRDFGYGQFFIEVKSKRGSSSPEVEISSEGQLSINSSERLFLYVIELNSATCEGDGMFSLDDVVNEVEVLFDNPMDRALFQEKLANVGYFQEDDYSAVLWSEGKERAYEVKEGFPRIDSRSCPPGVKSVAYKIDLDYCSDFEIDKGVIARALRG